MNNSIDLFLNDLKPTLQLVDEVLSAWRGEGNYHIPNLMGDLCLKLNWDTKTARRYDGVIRLYLKNHPNWYITQGAGGGVGRRADLEKKQALRQEKEKHKKEIQEVLDNRVAQNSDSE